MDMNATTERSDKYGAMAQSSHQGHDAASVASEAARNQNLTASQAAMECFMAYARERPEVVALWALGIGFVLGWKMKPW